MSARHDTTSPLDKRSSIGGVLSFGKQPVAVGEGPMSPGTMESGGQAKLMLRKRRRRLRSPVDSQPFVDSLETSGDGPRVEVQGLRNLFVRLSLRNMRKKPQLFLPAIFHRRARCGQHSIPNPLDDLLGQMLIDHGLSGINGLNALGQYFARGRLE